MVGRHAAPFKGAKRSQNFPRTPHGPCERKCRPNCRPKLPAKNCRPKKCRQKHADMSPFQSPAQRVPIGRCARSWRAVGKCWPKNCRPKMSAKTCRQKHADMSPPQSFHERVPIGRRVLKAGGRVGLGSRPSLPRSVTLLATACRSWRACRFRVPPQSSTQCDPIGHCVSKLAGL
jgi:hypothetical protein